MLGMGLYGRGFSLDDPFDNGLNASASSGISGGPYTSEVGFWGFLEVSDGRFGILTLLHFLLLSPSTFAFHSGLHAYVHVYIESRLILLSVIMPFMHRLLRCELSANVFFKVQSKDGRHILLIVN